MVERHLCLSVCVCVCVCRWSYVVWWRDTCVCLCVCVCVCVCVDGAMWYGGETPVPVTGTSRVLWHVLDET